MLFCLKSLENTGQIYCVHDARLIPVHDARQENSAVHPTNIFFIALITHTLQVCPKENQKQTKRPYSIGDFLLLTKGRYSADTSLVM